MVITSETNRSQPSKSGTDFVDSTSLKQILNISDAVMDQAMGIAYQLYITGRFAQAEVVCKGLIACDHRYWWSHSLHASILRRLDRTAEALAAVEEGLKYEPGQAKLTLMRAELQIILARAAASRAQAGESSRRASETPITTVHVPAAS
jgi:predicted Zn-dependent protease